MARNGDHPPRVTQRNERRWRLHSGFRHLSQVSSSCLMTVGVRSSLSDRETCPGEFITPPDVASRSVSHLDCDVQVVVLSTVTRVFKLAAASWSSTAWGTSGWSCTGWSTSSWSGTSWGTSWSGTGWSTGWLAAATNLAASDLGHAELWQLEAARLLAAASVASAVAAARGNWS